MTEGRDVVVRYITAHDPLAPGHIPVLLRIVRNEDGYEREKSWRPREERWIFSRHLLDERYGKSYEEFVDIDEQQALAGQEARREQVRRLDADAPPPPRPGVLARLLRRRP